MKHKLNRARSTVAGYLAEFIAEEKPASISPWVADAVYRQVAEAAMSQGERRLTPIFERLDGRVPYDTIRLVMAHLEALPRDQGATECHPALRSEPRTNLLTR